MRISRQRENGYISCSIKIMKIPGMLIPWVPEGFFFRSKAAIVSGEASIEIAAPSLRKKNPSAYPG